MNPGGNSKFFLDAGFFDFDGLFTTFVFFSWTGDFSLEPDSRLAGVFEDASTSELGSATRGWNWSKLRDELQLAGEEGIVSPDLVIIVDCWTLFGDLDLDDFVGELGILFLNAVLFMGEQGRLEGFLGETWVDTMGGETDWVEVTSAVSESLLFLLLIRPVL